MDRRFYRIKEVVMEKYLVTVGWLQRRVEQVRITADSGHMASCLAIDWLRRERADSMVQCVGGEDFRATGVQKEPQVIEVQVVSRLPTIPRTASKGAGRGKGSQAGRQLEKAAAGLEVKPRAGRTIPCRDKKKEASNAK